jgi:hypothetical protein
MSRWLIVALALIFYAAGMAALWWMLDLAIAPLQVWLFATIGQGGAWAALIALVVGSAVMALYLHKADGRAAGKAGRNRSP